MNATPDFGSRIHLPKIRLTKDRFGRSNSGKCFHCLDCDGDPGIVMMHRDSIYLQLMPDRCGCLLCGQQYYIEYEDLEGFLGCHPSVASIKPYSGQKYRSIDADWHSSLQLATSGVQ